MRIQRSRDVRTNPYKKLPKAHTTLLEQSTLYKAIMAMDAPEYKKRQAIRAIRREMTNRVNLGMSWDWFTRMVERSDCISWLCLWEDMPEGAQYWIELYNAVRGYYENH